MPPVSKPFASSCKMTGQRRSPRRRGLTFSVLDMPRLYTHTHDGDIFLGGLGVGYSPGMTVVLSLADGRTVHSVMADGDTEPEPVYQVVASDGSLLGRFETISDVCRCLEAD